MAARGARAAACEAADDRGASLEALAERLGGLRQGLKDIGYVEGENVALRRTCAPHISLGFLECAPEHP